MLSFASRWVSFTALSSGIVLLSCAVNPATGRREISLVSESQEIAMGREADPAATAQFGGLYSDDELQQYVVDLGNRLAAISERPTLPWEFHLVDHELVNAFALPGGFIYITRGILAHMNSEAELAGVLGHEIGHVTARHSAGQITRAQLGTVALIGGAIFSETLRNNLGGAAAGLQLLMLKYGRDDESEADALGYRYVTRERIDPRGISDVMRMLQSTSPSAEEMGIPGWMLSHPDPGDRVQANDRRIRDSGIDFSTYTLGRDAFLQRLDGLVFGEDPHQGYLIGERFIHPDLQFEITFPAAWRIQNSPSAVQAGATSDDAVMQLTFSESGTPSACVRAFVAQDGVTGGRTGQQRVNGLEAIWADFTVQTQSGEIRGRVQCVAHRDNVYQVLGYGTRAGWNTHAASVGGAMSSFKHVGDARYTSVSPHRIEIVQLPRDMTFEEFKAQYPSTVPDDDVKLANQVGDDDMLPRGRVMKRITGGHVPTS